jgi:hypothetical protein
VLLILRFLALAMALVVPLQGMAAASAGICMSLGHHDTTAADHAHGEQAGQHDAHDHAMHSHSDGEQASAGDAAGDASHCGPCMACCASASIAGPLALAIASSQPHLHDVFSQYPPLGVEPAGLYRPPLAL